MIVSVGIIGYKNHAKRLIDLFGEDCSSYVKYIFHPSKKLNILNSTNELKNLYDCDAIVICSPNHTHFNYLNTLLDEYRGYIFCEKPPVTSMDELRQLENISEANKKRVFFNFNFRFGIFNEAIVNYMGKKELGEIHHINFISSHGLAFKEIYKGSWRADKSISYHAITDIVAIHFIDILMLNFGKLGFSNYSPKIIAKRGSALDSAQIGMSFLNGVTASIYVSYAAPFFREATIIGTNGYIKINDDELNLFSPRETFDKEGFFICPPKQIKSAIKLKEDYLNSLKKSISYFLSIVKNNNDLKCFDLGIQSNKVLLNIKSMSSSD
tara:strand:- start:895 stop:1869 length:975 start_codon:yes stop_codon:yes gene_type:complete